jgi:predicted 2-oxoglutarate/Fe(II)-dependent dioxygenase YbiX
MNKNLESYVFVFKNILSTEVCNDIIDSLNLCKFNRHIFTNYNNEFTPSDIDPDTYSPHIELNSNFDKDLYKTLMDTIYQCLSQYINTLDFTWYARWNGYTPIKFNRYFPNTGMAEHCDHIQDIFDGTIRGIPVLTVIGLLNDEFDGGELILFEDVEFKLNKGDMIIFPSIFLYPHKINPLMSGIRHSFISWVY